MLTEGELVVVFQGTPFIGKVIHINPHASNPDYTIVHVQKEDKTTWGGVLSMVKTFKDGDAYLQAAISAFENIRLKMKMMAAGDFV